MFGKRPTGNSTSVDERSAPGAAPRALSPAPAAGPPPVAPAGIEGRAGCDADGPTRAGRRLELGLDRVEVAYGVAEVLPLLAEDHVQARTGGLLAFGIVRILARRG